MMHMGIVDRDSLNVKTKCHLEFIRDFQSRLNDKCGFQVQFPVGGDKWTFELGLSEN